MTRLSIGDVITLPIGLRCRHNQAGELTTIDTEVNVVIESVWPIVAGVGGTNHFEDGTLVAARALNTDGTYFPEGALLTLCFGAGDFRPEFILADKPNLVLRKMIRTFIAPPDVTP
jgi:hypothetical protein